MAISAAIIAAFFMGALPSSYLLVKFRTGKDIRSLGSGNPGATNVFRSVGKREGWIVLGADISKGAAAVLLLYPIVGISELDPATARFLIGLGAILGHVFTPFLKFKGGKGVATSAGVGLAVYPVPLVIALAVWTLLLLTVRYMSIASIGGAYAFALSCIVLIKQPAHIAIAILIAVFITWTHRSNITRLMAGQEPKFLKK